jgi:hypothetical protein
MHGVSSAMILRDSNEKAFSGIAGIALLLSGVGLSAHMTSVNR